MPEPEYVRQLRSKVGRAMLLLPSVTTLVFDEQGRVLLVEHADTRCWVAPGGAVEPRETPADAAVRETWEETGLLTRPRHVLGVFGGDDFVVRYGNGDVVSYVMTVFESEVLEGSTRPDGVEVVDARYFGSGELPEALAAWARIVLTITMANRSVASFTAPTWRPPA